MYIVNVLIWTTVSGRTSPISLFNFRDIPTPLPGLGEATQGLYTCTFVLYLGHWLENWLFICCLIYPRTWCGCNKIISCVCLITVWNLMIVQYRIFQSNGGQALVTACIFLPPYIFLCVCGLITSVCFCVRTHTLLCAVCVCCLAEAFALIDMLMPSFSPLHSFICPVKANAWESLIKLCYSPTLMKHYWFPFLSGIGLAHTHTRVRAHTLKQMDI